MCSLYVPFLGKSNYQMLMAKKNRVRKRAESKINKLTILPTTLYPNHAIILNYL